MKMIEPARFPAMKNQTMMTVNPESLTIMMTLMTKMILTI